MTHPPEPRPGDHREPSTAVPTPPRRPSGGVRAGLRCLALAGLPALALACGPPPPNLVIVSMDTTRADHLGAYGWEHARTPTIDALAGEGFLFRRHLTPVPITLPAHTSLMTGHDPPTHTVRDNGTYLVPDEATTLAEVLAGAGYHTAAFVGSFPLSARFGLDQGFAVYDDHFHRDRADRQRQAEDIFFDERPARAVVDAAIGHLRERPAGPFFAFLHFFDPHQPLQPPPPYDLEFAARPYDGEIAAVDEQIGRFFAYLREAGQWENTIVVLTADHGEGLGEHGELTHAMLLHQATLHIPLVIRGPGLPVGSTSAWTASTQLFATLLDLLGVEAPPVEIPRGPSLRPLLESGGEVPPGTPPFEAYFETVAPRATQGWSQLSGFMRGDWRLVHGPSPSLHDLDADPEELEDRFAAEPVIARGLFEELARHLAEHQTATPGESFSTADAETAARLAALGYLDADAGSMQLLDDMLDVSGLDDPRDLVVDVSVFSQAKQAMADQRWAIARGLLGEVIRRSPGNIQAREGLAILLAIEGRWPEALEALDEVVRERPEATSTARLRGELLVENGRLEEGLELLQGLGEESVEAWTWIGTAQQRLGRPAEAETSFRRGLEVDPQSLWLRLYLANALAIQEKGGEAEDLYREVLGRDPYFQLACYNFGRLLLDRGDRAAARGLLERAAELNPNHQLTRQALTELDA